ncbi:MAG: UDP-N-acetylmuramate dehydrogenase [Burkholderiaceae bacterium]|nr:UDP-N-acetylmuramate dehydrogenase [Burkholderiaceae bacterium]
MAVQPTIESDVPLAGFNSFGVAAVAGQLATLGDEREIPALLDWCRSDHPAHVLGAGCNTLLATGRVERILRVALAGRRIVAGDGERVLVEAAAGEDWPALVEWTLAQGLCGLENLSLIPGSVGAAPIQNIGAYGVELAERFDSLEAVRLDTGERRRFSRADCRFGYRDSVFKSPDHRGWLILSLRLALSRRFEARLDYGDIRRMLADTGEPPTARAVADAVIALRRARLPDPAILGNAGSFFKNPIVDGATRERLRERHPDLPTWPAGEGRVKLPAAWLIERAGWKGHRDGDAGVHDRHALVLVNHGHASGTELLALANRIRESVLERFGVRLEPEPVILR